MRLWVLLEPMPGDIAVYLMRTLWGTTSEVKPDQMGNARQTRRRKIHAATIGGVLE